MLRLEAVSKRYGRGDWVLRDVNVEAPAGEIVAFAGGNGSGKSTLLRIAVGLSRPTRGAVAARPPVVGYVPDRFSPNERMSAAAYLTHMGRVRGLATSVASARAGRLMERLTLVGGKDAPLRSLSKGNAQKVALAQALLVEPGLLVLDEPWSGLDADAHRVLAEIMTEVAASGGAVVFTDHRESVTRAHATRTYTVGKGRVSLRGPEAWPTEQRPVSDVILTAGRDGPLRRDLAWEQLDGVLTVSRDVTGVRMRVERESIDALLFTALQHGWSVERVTGMPDHHRMPNAVTNGDMR
ncbi:ABC transporter ATP-binding protein [Streptomyces sp. Isolate_45]|uniref:ATP-binding cassette domain-containing protein n=1 Tax=Streptomyces sp. Isolate_45 TaxID=2950111 RepID=UPI002481A679|nr:ABC transporter ATP-binding protein [Streptomyces sp. Isolate_45]MDA5281187.1 ABC transporter ATP-binding protein [Streptomyces sp. Isolate_45]